MPPPTRRPPPPEQLVSGLQEARLLGLDWQQAWGRAWDGVIWPHDTDHRRQWKAALRSAKAEYRACFEGRESRAAQVCAALFNSLQREYGGLHDRDRVAA